jgi:inner membrane protein
MMARSHVAIGIAAWVAAAPLLRISPFDLNGIGLAVVGSLLPDVDHPASWVGRRTRPVSTALAAVLGHRGVTHSAIAIAVLTFVLLHAGLHRNLACALAVGYLSHLAADILTPRGLRLTWPSRRVWSLPICRTGSLTEPAIVLAFCSASTWWILRHNGHWLH